MNHETICSRVTAQSLYFFEAVLIQPYPDALARAARIGSARGWRAGSTSCEYRTRSAYPC